MSERRPTKPTSTTRTRRTRRRTTKSRLPRRSPTTSPGKTRIDVLRFLGLAHRAGAVTRGTGAVREALRRGEAHLVLLARDASPTQTTKITGILEHRDIPSDASWTQAELGRALGVGPVSAVAVTDPALAAGFLEKLAVDTGRGSDPKTEEEDRTHAG